MHRRSSLTSIARFIYVFTGAVLLAASAACSGDSTTGLSEASRLKTGSLVVTTTGLPGGVTAPLQLTKGQTTRDIASGTVVGNLETGDYNLAASTVTSGGITYQPQVATQLVTIAINKQTTTSVAYAVRSGSMNVTINGLPGGASGTVTISGPNGYAKSVTSSQTITDLVPGTYTVSAASVVVGGSSYAATPASQTVSVVAGNSVAAQVTYAAGAPSGDDLSLEFAYLTQAVQRPDNSVSLVAGRSALLRVFAVANHANSFTPAVRVRVYDGATLIQTSTINPPEGSVRTATAEGVLNSTWNTVIPAANVRVNMRVLVDIDPDNAIAENDESNNVWPRGGTPKTVSVLSVPSFNVRMVPVTVGGVTGNVSDANKDQFLGTVKRVWPLNTVNADVRLPFTSSVASLQSDGTGWLTVLSEINSLRAADGAPSNLHYFGVVKVTYNSGVAGYGYQPGRAAIGWDYLPSGDAVAAHEWGHNFNRPHAPCGGAASAETSFPYAGGTIGMYGWNSTSGALVAPSATDIMGYCSNQWISDYAWSQAITYRQSSGAEAAAATGSVSGASATRGDGLLVWGRITNGQVTLEPAFRVDAAPTVPSTHGTHRLEALDRNGHVIAELPLEAQKVDHVENVDERQFAVVLPWSARLEKSLATLRVRDARTALVGASRTSSAAVANAVSDSSAPHLADPADAVENRGGDRVRVRWNRAKYPMAMARDASTGQIVAFLRQTGDEFVARNGRAVDIVYSDGVRSVKKRHQR